MGFIDNPPAGAIVEPGPFLLWGWVMFPSGPAARVDLSAGGRALGRARMGMERIDVAEATGRPAASISGFQAFVDLGFRADDGEATITAIATAMDGETFTLPAVTVGIVDRRVAEAGDADVIAPAARVAAGAGSGIRCLAFTHDLEYGGAQLYLSELLARLSEYPDFTSVVVSPADGPLRAVVEAAGASVHVIGAYPSRGPDEYESAIADLIAWAQPQGFTVVIANTLLTFPGADVAGRLGLPCIWAIHESYELEVAWPVLFPAGLPEPYVRRRAQHALSTAGVLVFEARATLQLYERHRSGERSSMRVVPYGIELAAVDAHRSGLDVAAARSRRGIPERAMLFLCVATFESRKAQASMVQAFETVAAEFPDAHLALVGDAPGRFSDAIHGYVRAAGLETRVTIAPVTADVLSWYGIADVFVIASDVESLPRTILETMAFGVPVMATAVFGIPELIVDGRTGWLFAERDVSALREAMRRVAALTPEQRRAVGQAGEAVVRERHSSSGYAGAYHGLMTFLSATSA